MIKSEHRSLQQTLLGGQVGDGAGWRLRHGLGESADEQKVSQRIDDR
jgi:hypothetical protein